MSTLKARSLLVLLASIAIAACNGASAGETQTSSSEPEYGTGSCSHVYIGMKFELNGGMLISDQQYTVESFNPSVPLLMTVKSQESGTSLEIPCEMVSPSDGIK